MRVALLAPMQQELAPLVRRLRLERDGGSAARFVGRYGPLDLLAVRIGIGTEAAAQATTALLDEGGIDRVMVVGIAGGVDAEQPIGANIDPELVVDAASGRAFHPLSFGAETPHGRLLTSDRLVTDLDEAERLRQQGVVGLDMETAAVAAVCEARSCPWSVFRAISDRVTDGTTDPAILALAGADGRGDVRALVRFLASRPGRIVDLVRLARGTRRAVEAAAVAAIRGLDHLCA